MTQGFITDYVPELHQEMHVRTSVMTGDNLGITLCVISWGYCIRYRPWGTREDAGRDRLLDVKLPGVNKSRTQRGPVYVNT